MYQYILFDLDGTVVDSGEGIIASAKYALTQLGIEDQDDDKLKQFVGPPLVATFQRVYQFTEERAVLAAKIFREYYDKQGKFQCALYEGMDKVLSRLHSENKTLIIATSKPTNFAKDIAEYLGIACYFDDIIGSNLDNTRSKKGEILSYIIEKYDIENLQDAVMIGDTVHDKIGAEQVGMPFIGVSYGYGFQIGEADADGLRLAGKPAELMEIAACIA